MTTRRKIISPNPKTVGELRFAISGYEDCLALSSPVGVFINDNKNKPYTMTIEHCSKNEDLSVLKSKFNFISKGKT